MPVAPLSVGQLEHEAQAKATIATDSSPYPDNRHPLAALPEWVVPTCHLSLEIGLT
jgi:hypothetical protein